jgi:formylglycine-generating enzyme required for sulfatase activity
MTMLYVPAGQFTMGLDNDKYETDNPAHKITLSDYWIDQTEVTNAMYQKCVDAQACATPYSVASGSIKPYYGNSNYAGFPVIHIPWQEASNYCEWVGRRLPSEAQWEKAARGSTDERIYPWGDDDPFRDLSNFGGLVGNTTAVNEQSDGKSPYGALNMAGNVWEWVSDLYDPDYYNKSLSKDPEGPVIGDKHVMRGGSWKDFPSTIRVVHRYADYPLYASSILGFRCSYPPKK